MLQAKRQTNVLHDETNVRACGENYADLLHKGVKNGIRFCWEPALFKRSGLMQATELGKIGSRLACSF